MTRDKKRVEKARKNLELAYSQFENYCSKPAATEREKAGIIQAFEFTLEAFYRYFQSHGIEEGLQANSPKQAMQAALQLGLISVADEEVWLDMVDDRNKTSHIYHKQLSEEILQRILKRYRQAFKTSFQKIVKGQG